MAHTTSAVAFEQSSQTQNQIQCGEAQVSLSASSTVHDASNQIPMSTNLTTVNF